MAKVSGKKRALLLIGGIVAALALALLALVLFVDMNRYKPRFESAASKVLGLDLRIRGEMNIVFFPLFGLSLTDLHVTRGGEEVLRLERMRVGLKILPLLWGQVRFRELGLVRPALSLQRTASGPFDFERYVYRPLRNARDALPGAFGRIDEISVAGGIVSYAGKDSAFRAGVEGLDLTIREIAFQENFGEDPFRTVSFAGTGKAARAAVGSAEASGVAFGITAKNGNYEVRPVTLQAFGGTGEGSVWVNLSASIPLVHVQYSQTGFRLEELFSASGRKHGLLEGKADLSANLLMKGETPDALAGTMTGEISWKGNDLKIPEFDPDPLLSDAGERKGVPLARMGALLLPGPPFTAAAGGLSGPDAIEENAAGEGQARALVSLWTIKNGVFEANDVAFATKGHRVALAGKIDLPGEQFDDITVALVDERGCARAGQTIQGPFRLPRISEATAGKKEAPPEETPMGKAKETAPGEECEVFYAGSVLPPE